jgi:peptidoglycan hydrolase CwlO-like protein
LYLQFSSLQKEIEERANDIEVLKGEQVKLQGVIKSLEKDIQGLKREIQERDETIQDKVRTLLIPSLSSCLGGSTPGRESLWLLGAH